ncbi:MAG: autotransporter domain-containing protein [Deltaproteobacteria bacterium]|jgi:outer membrane autotransporter protein|nr:autotransporter domain-containing protein [Deltaproteobacteria bacterium]
MKHIRITALAFLLGLVPVSAAWGAFYDPALNGSQRAVAAALDGLNASNPLRTALAGVSPTDVARTLKDLSGEAHAALTAYLMDLGYDFDQRLSRRLSQATAPETLPESGWRGFWLQGGGSVRTLKGHDGTAASSLDGPSLNAGFDPRLGGGWLLGAALHYASREMKVEERQSYARIASYGPALYGGKETRLGGGTLRLVLRYAHTWHELEFRRDIPALKQNLSTFYGARSQRLSLEGAYVLPLDSELLLEPFLNLGRERLALDEFMEDNGSAALSREREARSLNTLLAGLRLQIPVGANTRLGGELGWRHLMGDLAPESALRLRAGGEFHLRGSRLDAHQAVLALHWGLRLGSSLDFGLSYNAAVGSRGQSYGGEASLTLKW